MIEPLVFQPNKKAGLYWFDGDLNKIRLFGRQAGGIRKLDISKQDPTANVNEYHKGN